MPEVLQARPDAPADLGPCSSACGIDQLSREMRTPVRWPAKLTGSPGRYVRGSEGPGCRPLPPGESGLGLVLAGPPDLLGDSRSRLRSRAVEQHSLATRAPFRRPAGLTSSPGRSGLGPMACRVNQRSQSSRSRFQLLAGSTTCLVGAGAVFQSLWCRKALPGVSGPCLMTRDVNQLYRTTCAQVQGPMG